ncbi:MAG: SdiA-regulated domain-containing protein, partial [Gemmatimonadetes bacterium]|nr:SdiA-regulated domain-containing protein [Gemmatimonadota bacterium]
TPDGRLFAHDDERAVIYEIDFVEGEFVKGWAFGDPPARGDFEGIAVTADRVWLVTSDGRLYEGREGEDDERVLFNTYGTGVGRACEVEGLVYEPSDDALSMVCKTPRTAEFEGVIAIYRWSLETRALLDPPITVPRDELAPDGGFSPSGIERDPATGHYLLLAAREERIAEIDPTGRVIEMSDLSREAHPQAEGIAIGDDLTLFIADEGGDRRARLKLYSVPRE